MTESRQSSASAEDILLAGHDVDGIREYDNPMPFWWSALFWGTIVFSVMYVGYYMIGVGPGVRQDYEDEVSAFFQEQAAKLGDLQPTPRTLIELGNDPKMMQAAQGLFRTNCAVCHGPDGGGGTGPNLRDDSYLNIRRVEDIYAVITNGVVPKGMPAWEKRFGQAQRVLLSAYVAHLRGQQPNGAKAPQGNVVPAWAVPDSPEAGAAAPRPASKEAGAPAPRAR